jgi:spore maturation protein CgeB
MKTKSLEIAFFGSSLVSAYWNGAATYYRGIIKSLYKRGHHVTFYEPDAFDRQQHRDISDPEWAKVVVYQPEKNELYKMLEDASSADVIIKASGIGVLDDVIAHEVVQLRNCHNAVVFWDVDAPATLDSLIKNEQDPFRLLIPKYDFIFTYGGGDAVVNAYQKLKAAQCIPVYNALDPETHYEVPPAAKFDCDLAFLGNRLPDREHRVEHFFLQVAEELPSRKFILGGSGWGDKELPANVNYLGHVYTEEHNAFNCTPKAVLNISRQSMADYGFSPATRVFEAAGAGACIITDYWNGIEYFLEPDHEILIAQNNKDVKAIIDNLDPVAAKKIGVAAKRKVSAQHTYDHRAEQVEKILLN